MDQYYFVTPFAALGDQSSFPIPTDPGGGITFQQGWGPDYALDQTSNPNAKPIDRASTNYLMYVITNALAALQRVGIPEWITSANNNGAALPYPKYAQVRYSATSPATTFTTWISSVDNNTSVPGADANWQAILSIAAGASDVNSGSPVATLTVTPAALQLYAGNSAQTFKVAAATAGTQAPQTNQVQQSALNYAGVAGGTANALTAALAPAPTALTDELFVIVRVLANNTGATTLALGSLGAVAVVGQAHSALQGNELVAGGFARFDYSTSLAKWVLVWATGGAEQVGAATASNHAMQLGQATGRLLRISVYRNNAGTLQVSVNGGAFVAASATFTALALTTAVDVEAVGGGGGSGGTPTTGASQYSGTGPGGSGSYGRGYFTASFNGVTITVGAGGAAGAGGASPTAGTNGAASSFGALLTTQGGGASSAGVLASTSNLVLSPSAAAVGAGAGGYINMGGACGAATIGISGALVAGYGASSPLGAGGGSVSSGVGNAGTGYGSGAGGSGIGVNTAGFSGGPGASGCVIVREYA